MLLQTNSYIVPPDRRGEHARLVRRFRQTLLRLGCATFEVYEQVGANWSAGESSGRFVQIMRFTDRKQQLAVQNAERHDPQAQAVIAEFCDLINFPAQQQQGLFALGFYTSVLSSSARRLDAEPDAAALDAEQGAEPQEAPASAPVAANDRAAAAVSSVAPTPQVAIAEPSHPASAALPVAPLVAPPTFDDPTATAPVSPAPVAATQDPEPTTAESFEPVLDDEMVHATNETAPAPDDAPARSPFADTPNTMDPGADTAAILSATNGHATPTPADALDGLEELEGLDSLDDPLDPSADFEDLLNVTDRDPQAARVTNDAHRKKTNPDAAETDARDAIDDPLHESESHEHRVQR